MKSKRFVLGLILSAVMMAGPVLAQGADAKSYHWDDKLIRGFLNIVSSPVEIARTIHLTTDESSLLEGWTVGLIKGLGNGIVRLGVGVVDFFTFPFNFPDESKGPLIEPEYVWEKPGIKYTS